MWSNISHARGLREQQELGQVKGEQQVRSSTWGSPLMRYKHAVCSAASGYIYIHGGRFGNLPLDDDVWRFDPHQNAWLQLQTAGSKPPSLQEHTLVEFDNQLYLFGGQVSASNTENSFWRLNLASCQWQSLDMKSSKFGAHLGPTNRRGHSAVVHDKSMYIFGGFEDFRGSSGQLWQFQLLSERWELCNLSSTSACHPEPRHSHSAVVLGDAMYVYGGLANLKPLSDLWRWSWREKRWFKERTRGKSPGPLHGHTAIQTFGSMFVFGGERNGRPTRGLWRLNLSNMSWQKIRPKGPRPNPTTWHGAIANPLSILDEANYIIEGDPELLKSGASLSDNCFAYHDDEEPAQHRFVERTQSNHRPVKAEPAPELGSLNPPKPNASNNRTPLFAQNHQERTKRKSRLGFLRRDRQPRPRSTYELKQISAAASDSCTIAHSVSIASTLDSRAKAPATPTPKLEVLKDTNVEILDNLDTDIKQMFQRAMSPTQGDEEPELELCEEEEEPMSVDASRTLNQTSRSQYHTAARADSFAELNLRSQRTSYAYTTPPSELNTLRDRPAQVSNQVAGAQSTLDRLVSQGLLSSANAFRGDYNRRDNRPKSEIVQSLIDRADARIKHLYTPFFGQQPNGEAPERMFADRRSRDGDQRPRNRRSLDKSKRHTIHQTMTYYNLYFSEDKSSNSPPSSDSNNAAPAPDSRPEEERLGRLVRDDLSSGTVKALATSGALVGVRGGSQVDRDSQLSLEVSSDSRTLCGELARTQQDSGGAETSNSVQSSVPNALTARRDTASESCDNTSLSFSVIAEFEEDDMLQYSSPTEPIIMQRDYEHQGGPANYERDTAQLGMETTVKLFHDEDVMRVEQQPRSSRDQSKLVPTSTSSGYDSMSGHDRARETTDSSSQIQQNGGASTSDTQEDSSVQTDSSLGFTSPEQSAARGQQLKKLRARSILYRRKTDLKTTTSSTTADSLALASDCFGSSSLAQTCPPAQPTKSLPSSPPEKESSQQLQSSASFRQPSMPLVSRSTRFFSKQKSKNRYWQLCMFVIGGKQNGVHGNNEPITIWRLYI